MSRARLAIFAAAVCCVSCTLSRLAAGQAEAPALPAVLAALNISNANASTVQPPPPGATSNGTLPAAPNTDSGAAPPAADISNQPPLEVNTTGAGSSNNATDASTATLPALDAVSGPPGNTSANASGNASAPDALADYITLSNSQGMTVVVLPLGAIIQRLIVPDRNGTGVDVVLGFDTASEYLAPNLNLILGAVTGRVSNRIPGANFTFNNVIFNSSVNDNVTVPGSNGSAPNTTHGGFAMRVWDARKVQLLDGEAAVLHLVSPDGDQGFPGTVHAWVIYKLWADSNRLQTTWLAATDKPTPISLSTNTYFNLNGHNSSANIADHTVQLHNEYYAPVHNTSIRTTLDIAPVAGSPFDLRQPAVLGTVTDQVAGPDPPPDDGINMITPLGYPGSTNQTQPTPSPVLVANISSPLTGITLGVLTNAPGFQWNTGSRLPGPGEPPITGKSNAQYVRRGGSALQPQGWPNAVQQPNFPSIILSPGQVYEQHLVWEFGLQGGSNATAGNETAANGTAAANATGLPAAGNATAGNASAPVGNATVAGPVVGSATEIGLDNSTALVIVNDTLPGAAAPVLVAAPDVTGSDAAVPEDATGSAAGAGGGATAAP